MCHYYGTLDWIAGYERRRDAESADDADEDRWAEMPTLVAPGDD